jgi:dolichyl-phosphate-mannose--protein O-mannosyl transferase
MVKLNSLILILLYIPLFYKEYKNHISIKEALKKVFLIVLVSIASIMIIFKLHFTLTQNLIKTKTYNLTKSEIKLVNSKKLSLIDGIKAYIRYIKIYEKGVPKYNPCKKNGENGSLVMTWPLMDKTINYRWKKVDNKTKYLYLVGNPLIWLTGLIGVLLSISMLVGRFVYGLKIKSSKFEYIFIFTILYISYMIAVLQIDRVMYLYHYFIPLIFSFILAVLQFEYLFEDCLNKKDKVFLIASGLFIALILYVWWWFSPLTYYEYLDIYQFNQRNWFDFWQLKAVS